MQGALPGTSPTNSPCRDLAASDAGMLLPRERLGKKVGVRVGRRGREPPKGELLEAPSTLGMSVTRVTQGNSVLCSPAEGAALDSWPHQEAGDAGKDQR